MVTVVMCDLLYVHCAVMISLETYLIFQTNLVKLIDFTSGVFDI